MSKIGPEKILNVNKKLNNTKKKLGKNQNGLIVSKNGKNAQFLKEKASSTDKIKFNMSKN